MQGLLLAAGGIISLVCIIIILIDAFQNEIWKGVVGLFCGLYLLYYAFVEFEHENKWLIILGLFAGNILAAVGKFSMAGN